MTEGAVAYGGPDRDVTLVVVLRLALSLDVCVPLGKRR